MSIRKMNLASIGTGAEAILTSLSRLSLYWPFSWRSVSALILGVFLAKWFWILFAPQANFTAAMPEHSAGLEAGKLFGVVQSAGSSTQGVALLNVQLIGVFAPNVDKPGFAILKLDDKRQVGVAENEEVAAGTKLVEVHNAYVLLERGGIQQRVNLENKYAGSTDKGIQPAKSDMTGNRQVDDIIDKSLRNRLHQQGK